MAFYSRYMDEPHRASENGSSNYYIVPTQCPNCKFSEKMESNWPIRCKAPYSSEMPSRRAFKEGNRQYDVCKFFKEKESLKAESFVTSSFSSSTSSRSSFESYEEETPQQKRERREREREERERQREEEERLEELAQQEEARRVEEERMTCPYCGNKVKEGFYINFHGSNFHFECKEKFEKTSEGKNWIEKKLSEEKEFELQIQREIEIEEKEVEKDKKWISSTKTGKKCAAQYSGISDEDPEWDNIRNARLEYEKTKIEVEEWANKTESGKIARSECNETDEELRFEFLNSAYKAAQKTEKEEKELLESRKKKYSADFEKAKLLIGNTTLFEKDGKRVSVFLKSLKHNFNNSNETKLQKILNLDFQNPEEPKKGLIIAGIVLIISVSLSPLGIILLIVGLAKKKKAVKAMENAAQNNYNLLKEIMYEKFTVEGDNYTSEKFVKNIALEYCKKFINREFDSETVEKIILGKCDESKMKKAKDSFRLQNDENIVFGYDDTSKKSFKSGFVLTDKKLYFTDGNSFSKNISISVNEIKKIGYKKRFGVPNICFNDTFISITSPIGKDSEKLCEMLSKAVLILQNKNQEKI